MDISESSILSTANLSESSVNLNVNVDFSEINVTASDKNESTLEASVHTAEERPELSITLDQNEREMLKMHRNTCNSINSLQESQEKESITMDYTEIVEDASEAENITSVNGTISNLSNGIIHAHYTENIVEVEHGDIEAAIEIVNERDFFQKPLLIELGRRLWTSTQQAQCYTKGCLWAPDGTCILVPVHLDGMHVIEVPNDLYTINESSLPLSERATSSLPSAVHVKEGGTVYDYVWYPFMNSNAPETCCWLASRQHEPIHMWDAFDGALRCSYRGYDDVDEVESAISVTFSNNGEKIIGGYKKTIKIFDTNVPGRDCTSISAKQSVSCFALTSDNDDTITAGSWNGHIYHYDLRAPKLGPLFTLGGHTGGITWLRYAAALGENWMLFSGARKDNKILQWDMRNYTQPVREFTREVKTNQRIYFDLSPGREWLASGGTDGKLRIWDLCGEVEDFVLPLHDDCLNGINIHPTLPILASTSGQYHFVDVTHEEEEEKPPEKIVDYENSLLLLWFGRNCVNKG